METQGLRALEGFRDPQAPGESQAAGAGQGRTVREECRDCQDQRATVVLMGCRGYLVRRGTGETQAHKDHMDRLERTESEAMMEKWVLVVSLASLAVVVYLGQKDPQDSLDRLV